MLKRIRNYIIPTRSKNTLAMYQKIIVFGEWIVISFVILSVIMHICCGNFKMIELLKQYLVGIVCSMVVVIITSVLQFFRIRGELFETFYFSVLGIVIMFNIALNDHDLIKKDNLDDIYSDMKKDFEDFQKVAFNLFWFSAIKECEYTAVKNNIFEIKDLVKDVLDDKNEKNDANINRKIVKSTINSMVILSKKEFDDSINVFVDLKEYIDKNDLEKNNS